MNRNQTPSADTVREPGPEASLHKLIFDRQVIRRIPQGAADQLVSRGWAQWFGVGSRRHLELTPAAPICSLSHSLHGKDGTRPMRGDGSFRYGKGQLLGESQSHREFFPTH